jgi:hypothetical protein
MADRPTTDDDAELLRQARDAAHECQRAASQLVQFAQRLSAVIGPSEQIEYDTLVAREAATLTERVDAFARLGLGVPSIEATDQ